MAHGDQRGGQDGLAQQQAKADKNRTTISQFDAAVEPTQPLGLPPTEPPAVTAEMQDALFEEAMDQIVRNYSIVLNFNS